MAEFKLTEPRKRALAVLHWAKDRPQPVRSGAKTSNLFDGPPYSIHHKIADQLEDAGLAERVERYSYDYRLTAEGQKLAAELDAAGQLTKAVKR